MFMDYFTTEQNALETFNEEAYFGTSQTSMMELFAKIINYLKY